MDYVELLTVQSTSVGRDGAAALQGHTAIILESWEDDEDIISKRYGS